MRREESEQMIDLYRWCSFMGNALSLSVVEVNLHLTGKGVSVRTNDLAGSSHMSARSKLTNKK